MLKRAAAFALRIAEQRVFGVAFAALIFAGVLYLDRQTGLVIGVSLLYVGPIFLAALYLEPAWGYALAGLSGIAWFGLNALPRMAEASQPLALVWNALVRTGFFILAVSLARVYLNMREAQKVSALKSQMLSLVSHDLNNFTTVIKLAVEILADTDENPTDHRADAYATLRKNVDKISRTVRSFLDLARLESGRFELKTERVLLRDFTRNLAESFLFALERKKLSLELDIPEKPLPVRADQGVMTMVMGNLLSNSIKYTPEGGRVTIRLRDNGAGRAEITVQDTGIGIPLEDQEKIFSGFYRTEMGKSVALGEGLGLKITREMVVLHGGELKLESAPDRGSRFVFTLPLWEGTSQAAGFS